jgi:F5/8 type C domain.
MMDLFDDVLYVSETVMNRTILKSKVYRKTYSHNTESIRKISGLKEALPPEFSPQNYRFFDVTRLYANYFTNLEIPKELLYPNKTENGLVFLCAPAWLQWVPVDWCKAEKGKPISFDIDAGCVLRLAKFESGKLRFITDPFFVNKQTRDIKVYKSGEEKNSLTLFSKFSIEKEYLFRNRMVGGVFEGSHRPDFSYPDTLYQIKEMPFRLYTRVPVSSGKKYRYVRYKGPENSHCNVSEVQFYSDSTYLTGTVIGTPGCWQNDGTHEYTNVLDGLTETSFDHNTASDGWAGLDLGQPQKITEIVYSPRNYDNYIEEGQQYELFVSTEDGWKSLGSQSAASDSLRYDNIPVGGLYYLKNHSSGNEERVFVMEDNKQVFR